MTRRFGVRTVGRWPPGVGGNALVRAYRVGHGQFLRFVTDEVALRVRDAAEVVAVIRRLLDLIFRNVDRVSERVISAYQRLA